MSPGARWRVVRILAGAVLAAAALYLLFASVSGAELRQAIGQARAAWVMAALGTTLLTLGVVTVRWGVLLKIPGPIPGPDRLRQGYGESAEASASAEGLGPRLSFGGRWNAVVIGQAVNIVFPLRFGEGARVAVTCAETGRPAGAVTVAMAFERVLDTAAFATMLLFLGLAGQMPQAFDAALPTIIVFAIVTGAVLLALVRSLPTLLRWATARLRGDSRPARWLAAQEASARAAWTELARRRRLTLLVLLTALGLLASASTNLLIFRAFDLAVPAIAALVLLAVLQAGTAIVSVPGNIGVFHYLTVLTLGAWEVPASLALAVAIVLHAVSLGPRVLLGGMSATAMSWRKRAVPDVVGR